LPRAIEGDEGAPQDGFGRISHAAIAVLAVALVVTWFVLHDPLAQWMAACAFMLVAFVLFVQRPRAPSTAQLKVARWQELALWAIAGLCCFLALYGHRWRNDDCYYINIAVGIADLPDRPILLFNDTHGPVPGRPDANRLFPPYRVHSFEALGGMISFLSGIEAIRVVHLGLAGASALLIPLAAARLFRLLDPQRWFWMLLAFMCVQLFEGSSGLGYGSQGIVRMFTGKSVLVSVGVPLLVAHGIAFGLHPSARRLAMLTAAQIAAIGLTSTSLWLAPVGAMLAVAVPLRLDLRSLRTVALALLSCLYVIGMALWIRASIFGGGDPGSGGPTAAAAVTTTIASHLSLRFDLLWSAFRRMFQEPQVAEVYLSLLVLAIPLARTSLSRRYLIVFCLALLVLLMNPYFANWLRHNVFGRYTGQRTMWLAPVPAAVAIAFAAVMPPLRMLWLRAGGAMVMAACLYIFFSTVPTRAAYSEANGVQMHWPPEPKVPTRAFELAKVMRQELPPRAYVLAPEVVSWYLPTIHNHPYPVLANSKYLSAPRKDELRRKKLVGWVSGRYKKKGLWSDKRRRFIAGLNRYAVSGVVLNGRGASTPGMIAALKAAGFERSTGVRGYRFYKRTWTKPPRSVLE
jgi:hypothetical protein